MTASDQDDFNLLVSTGRGIEDRCISTLRGILSHQDPMIDARRSCFSGLVKCSVQDPRAAVGLVVAALEDEPWHNETIKRVVPIDEVVDTSPESILDAARRLSVGASVPPEWSFRVRVRKRGASLDRMKLIIELADLFQNKVNLSNPDFELRVEMLREVTGVSLIRRGDIFPDL